MKKISFIAFWDDFNYIDHIMTFDFLNNKNIKIISDHSMADIIFVGSFIHPKEKEILDKCKAKKILYITEPIGKMFKLAYDLFKDKYFDMVMGCIEHDIEKKYFKFPIYSFKININDKNIYSKINNYVKNIDFTIQNNKFCCLINNHDRGNTRVPIYNLLKNINNIDCPGLLLNNCSNNELNSIGNDNFLKKYKFNICSENYKCDFSGYITEKLMNSCLGGAIPIYYGHFDDLDEKIFNKNRIIFYDPTNIDSLNNAYNFILNLVNNQDKFEEFYKQNVFCDTAFDIIQQLKDTLNNEINNMIISE